MPPTLNRVKIEYVCSPVFVAIIGRALEIWTVHFFGRWWTQYKQYKKYKKYKQYKKLVVMV